MKIEVVHQRYSDGDCSIGVFVDGVRVEFEEYTADFGASENQAEFEENRQFALEQAASSSAAVRDAINKAFGD
ncbi:hypothetical protein AXK58_24345 [Tsukamurella tyrosinosolvens]|uniref:Uncharacterized protein n=1 Tax=Tsukamurella tyrosinosolvens TaxID=57704 RepID=A0A1H4UR71_TSUTY|nr:hypothetical protein [Tsukamurella tyrosinosolvens]KXO99087.1 hypothetical protein AXK58_24345 [Tsukamurella tyrosinosolvens]SEC70781.1 hypothetical protein SAMN04489793_2974 [Tsukamurella tyrosinosolvens]